MTDGKGDGVLGPAAATKVAVLRWMATVVGALERDDGRRAAPRRWRVGMAMWYQPPHGAAVPAVIQRVALVHVWIRLVDAPSGDPLTIWVSGRRLRPRDDVRAADV